MQAAVHRPLLQNPRPRYNHSTSQCIYIFNMANCYIPPELKMADIHSIPETQPVLNLSNHRLDRTETDLLTKGLTFVPTPMGDPRTTHIEELTTASDLFLKKLETKWYFRNHGPVNTKNFYVESQWVPPQGPLELTTMRNEIHQNLLQALNTSIAAQNVTPSQQNTIHSLARNDKIVIKKADKGQTIVLMNHKDYVGNCLTHLSDRQAYTPIPHSNQEEQAARMRPIIRHLLQDGHISQKIFNYIYPAEGHPTRERHFYGLPKIHKPKNTWTIFGPKIRPIVSDCQSATYNCSEYLTYLLTPLTINHPSYIQDTSDFLQKLKTMDTTGWPNGYFLASLDVTSLYTSIPQEQGLAAIRSALERRPLLSPPTEPLVQLARIILEQNEFAFAGHHFKQTLGISMGCRWAPPLANEFMAQLEASLLQQVDKAPPIWWRYLDDIFLIWPYSMPEWDQFLTQINALHDTIKFEGTIAENSLDFLDLTIYKDEHDPTKLHTKPFWKPTNSHQYLDNTSFHRTHTKRGVLLGTFLRIFRNTTETQQIQKYSTKMSTYLRRRGYKMNDIREAYTRARTLFLKGPSHKKGKNRDVIILPTIAGNFQPREPLKKAHAELTDTENEYRRNFYTKLFPKPPMVAYRKNPSLKDILVHSKTKPLNTTTRRTNQRYRRTQRHH